MAYETATEAAARIRAAYKAKGWSSRMIGVRADQYSMGSTIRVEIKDPRIRKRDAEEIANTAERISRCEMTGEILSGGNRFVDVEHSRECRDILARRYIAAVERACDELRGSEIGDENRDLCERVSIAKCRDSWNGARRIWIDDQPGMQFGDDQNGRELAAYSIAVAIE